MFLRILAIRLAVHAATVAPPFWKAKEKVYQRVQDGEVIVAVRAVDARSPRGGRRLKIDGGAQVRAPCDFVFAYARDIRKVATQAPFVEKAVLDGDRLKLTLAAFGHRTDLRLSAHVFDEAVPRRLEFDVLEGRLRGLELALSFDPIKASARPAKCEVGLTGDYPFTELALPKVFAEFGMEVVLQKMAERLRREVQGAYQAEGEKNDI